MSVDSEPLFASDPVFHNFEDEREYEPAVPNTGEWAGREAARTPIRFRNRVILAFRAPANLAYLRTLFRTAVPAGALRDFALQTLDDAVYTFSEFEGRAHDVLWSDPVARRGALRPAVGLWDEVKRLNRVFYEERLSVLRDHARMIEAGGDEDARRDGRPHRPVAQDDNIDGDDEPYHIRMFEADSLRPPGLEHLNSAGPLWGLREDTSVSFPTPPGSRGMNSGRTGSGTNFGPACGPRASPAGRREGFAVGGAHNVGGGGMRGASPSTVPPCGNRAAYATDIEPAYYGEEDSPWRVGNHNRTPEQALHEYYGEHSVASETAIGFPEQMGQTYGDIYSRGTGWQENNGTRFMRYPNIPIWQCLKREGYDTDIEETLGLGERELDAHVRRWSMDKVREPRGQDYRRYGVRSGHVV